MFYYLSSGAMFIEILRGCTYSFRLLVWMLTAPQDFIKTR